MPGAIGKADIFDYIPITKSVKFAARCRDFIFTDGAAYRFQGTACSIFMASILHMPAHLFHQGVRQKWFFPDRY